MQNLDNSKENLTRLIPEIFTKQEGEPLFPKEYQNDVLGWGNIEKGKLHSCLPDGTAKLLTLDLDFGNQCSLECPSCFRRDHKFDSVTPENTLTDNQIYDYIKQAKKLGLESIKILGRGEPFQNKDFLQFLRDMTAMNLAVGVFTKGHVLGSDSLTKTYNQQYGIETSEELVKELKKLKVGIYLGFNSFDNATQESYIGIEKTRIKDYVKLRNRALKLLVDEGFNEYIPGKPTRLCLCTAPIKPETMDEYLDIYKWGRKRNIYVVTCPTTISGKGIDELDRTINTYGEKQPKQSHEKYILHLEKVYSEVYLWAIKTGIISKKEFIEDGVSLYPGAHVCNQTAAGFFLNLSGQVVQCPGRTDGDALFTKDIRSYKNLKEVWMNSKSYKQAKNSTTFNYGCPARDDYSLPLNFYSNIKENVLKQHEIF